MMASDGATAKIHRRFMVLWYKEVVFNHRNTEVRLCWIQKEPEWAYVLVTFLVSLPWGEALTWGP